MTKRRKKADLFDKIATVIERNPSRWNQNTWMQGWKVLTHRLKVNDHVETVHCGSAHCIAGWAAVLDGGHAIDDNVVMRNGHQVEWEDAGRRALGITEKQANTLFDSRWKPDKQTARLAAKALRAIGNGASIASVSLPLPPVDSYATEPW